MAEEPKKGAPDKPVKVVKKAVKKPVPEAPAAAKPKAEAPKPARQAAPKLTPKEPVPAKPAAKRPGAKRKRGGRKERKPAKKEEKPAKKEPKAKEEAEEEEEEHEARKKPELEDAVRTALRIRGLIASRRPTFYRQEWYRYKRLGLTWRKPQGGQSKLRRHLGYRINVVSIGFRGPRPP